MRRERWQSAVEWQISQDLGFMATVRGGGERKTSSPAAGRMLGYIVFALGPVQVHSQQCLLGVFLSHRQ